MGRLRLFEDADGDNDDISKIEIDKEFAKRYQHNKEREDLQRYQELSKKGQIQESDSDSSSSEDDDEEEEFPDVFDSSYKKDLKFFENLLKVKNRDPCLYRPGEQLFESESESSDVESDTDGEAKKDKKKKAMYAKDVIAQHLLEEGPEFGETESSEKSRMKKKSYSEEQEDLRREFLNAVKNDEDENGEDFLRVKEKKLDANHEDSGYDELKNKLDEYFGRDEELDEGNKFLKDFFLNKRWLDKEGNSGKSVVEQSELDELLRDEEELERQEEYERRYNFRYEEDAGDRVMGHSRKVEGSVRKKENARKEQRKSKEERMKIAEQERKEELKHLKNLKKNEMKKKMEKLIEVAGIEGDADCPFDLDGLDDDFDPEQYDKLMKKAFNNKYYEMEDPDPDFGSGADEDGNIEKPDFSKEDELLGLPKDWDVLDSGDGFLSARGMSLKLKEVNDNDNEEEKDGEVNGEEKSKESKQKRKRKMSLVKKAKEEMMEEYYKLDYEDTIGDLKTRFKYAKVDPNRYGLKTEEILMMDDKELNQYVSVKKLTPYREKEWKLPNSKRYQLKIRAKEVVNGISKDQMTSKKRRLSKGDRSTPAMDSDQNVKPEPESNVDMGSLSRKAKRRQRKAELKLSHSRRIAYGEIQSSSKGKGNY